MSSMERTRGFKLPSDVIDMRNADWIVSLFMELADPTEEQKLIALSLFFAEIDHQLTRC
jgi:hypothetical protein